MTPVTPLENARDLLGRGLAVIPVPFRSKGTRQKSWQKLRLTEADLPEHFNSRPSNVGVLLGEPSGLIVDVDLDHELAVKIADRFLPKTDMVWGRAGKPRSHFLYRLTGETRTKKWKAKTGEMIVELRSSGCMTMGPGSTHPNGEEVCWAADGEAAAIDCKLLLGALDALANEVKRELGEVPDRPTEPRRPLVGHDRSRYAMAALQREVAIVAATPVGGRNEALNTAAFKIGTLIGAGCLDQQHAESELFGAARNCGLDEREARVTIASGIEAGIQQPRPLNAIQTQPNNDLGPIPGTIDPETGRLILSTERTRHTAVAFIDRFYMHPEGRTLHHHADRFLEWVDGRYTEIEDNSISARLMSWMDEAIRYPFDGRRRRSCEVDDFPANPKTVRDALNSIKLNAHLPVTTEAPSWIDGSEGKVNPRDILMCPTSWLHLPTMSHMEPTPKLFSTQCLDFNLDPNAPLPKRWIAFIEELFGDDIESLNLLEEWFGYCLTPDTSQQKMLLVVGPPRSGKGTLGRVLRRLVGLSNVAAPTTSSLAGDFGLQPLIDKSLAIVSDARLKGPSIASAVERLLCITGEDAVTVNRKYKASVTMKLPTRFMFLTNELPRVQDASGALPGRFLVLKLKESFEGREELNLDDTLSAELPGILNKAIEGRSRLHDRGRFFQPAEVADIVCDLANLSSPVGAFVRERCQLGPQHRVPIDNLYEGWKAFCKSEGINRVSPKTVFGRDLSAAAPSVKRRRNHRKGGFYEGIGLKPEFSRSVDTGQYP